MGLWWPRPGSNRSRMGRAKSVRERQARKQLERPLAGKA